MSRLIHRGYTQLDPAQLQRHKETKREKRKNMKKERSKSKKSSSIVQLAQNNSWALYLPSAASRSGHQLSSRDHSDQCSL
jgi:hypothetical protein